MRVRGVTLRRLQMSWQLSSDMDLGSSSESESLSSDDTLVAQGPWFASARSNNNGDESDDRENSEYLTSGSESTGGSDGSSWGTTIGPPSDASDASDADDQLAPYGDASLYAASWDEGDLYDLW
jgi:hypothetical protein